MKIKTPTSILLLQTTPAVSDGAGHCAPPNTSTPPTHPRGLLVMDAVWGIVLATILLMALTVAVVKQGKAERQLAENRAASRAAEAALLALQTGQQIPPDAHIEKIAADAPQGRAWVRVSFPGHGVAGELVGLVKADAVEGAR